MTTDTFRQEMLARFAASDARIDATQARTEARIDRIDEKLGLVLEGLREVGAGNEKTRQTAVVTGIASVLAVAALVVGLWAAGISRLSAFQAGLAAVTTVHPAGPAPGQIAPPRK